MSLPAPVYATTVSYTHSYATTPLYTNTAAILIDAAEGSPTGSPIVHDYIIWDNLVERDQQTIIDLVNRYGGTLPLASAVPASDSVDFGSAAAGDSTGLNGTEQYYATIYVDEVKYTDNWAGSNLSTYGDIVNRINTLLTGAATASLAGGTLTVTSSGSPVTSNTMKIQRGDDRNVFRRAIDFTSWGTPLLAASSTREMFERNQLPVNFARIP